jgi:hypothetical protein
MKKETGTRMFNMAKEMLENCEKDEDLRKKNGFYTKEPPWS